MSCKATDLNPSTTCRTPGTAGTPAEVQVFDPYDPDCEGAGIEIIDCPRFGVVADAGGGVLKYTPCENFVGVDDFSYTIVNSQDPEPGTGIVRIHVTGDDCNWYEANLCSGSQPEPRVWIAKSFVEREGVAFKHGGLCYRADTSCTKCPDEEGVKLSGPQPLPEGCDDPECACDGASKTGLPTVITVSEVSSSPFMREVQGGCPCDGSDLNKTPWHQHVIEWDVPITGEIKICPGNPTAACAIDYEGWVGTATVRTLQRCDTPDLYTGEDPNPCTYGNLEIYSKTVDVRVFATLRDDGGGDFTVEQFRVYTASRTSETEWDFSDPPERTTKSLPGYDNCNSDSPGDCEAILYMPIPDEMYDCRHTFSLCDINLMDVDVPPQISDGGTVSGASGESGGICERSTATFQLDLGSDSAP